jgi:hypothetical protein
MLSESLSDLVLLLLGQKANESHSSIYARVSKFLSSAADCAGCSHLPAKCARSIGIAQAACRHLARRRLTTR